MTKIYLYPFKLILFWIATFNLFRVAFGLNSSIASIKPLDIFTNALLLDISTASYLSIIAAFLWILALVVTKGQKIIFKILLWFNFLIYFIISLIELSSIPLFEEWGCTFNARAFEYVINNHDVWHTIKNSLSLHLILSGAIFLILGFIFLKLIHRVHDEIQIKPIVKILFPVVITLGLIIGIRGGVSNIPINISSAFYSTNQAHNYLSVNKAYYFVHSLKKKKKLKIQDKDMDQKTMDSIFHKLYPYPKIPNQIEILTTEKPNICLIILEGIPIELLKNNKRDEVITPNLKLYMQEGLHFNNIYSSGTRTDQGILSILSGVPALPYINIMNDVELVRQFPSLLRSFKTKNNSTYFFYGGNLNFSNLGNYFTYNNIDFIRGKNDFPISYRKIEWGVPDNLLLEKVSEDLSETEEPFFATILTQSSHTPYDLEGNYKYGNNDTKEMFESSVYYTDSCLGLFIDRCKTESWFKNTLFIVLSDHGTLALGHDFNDHKRFQIPLLFWGDVLKKEYKGKKIEHIGNHHDIPATLLSMLKINDDEYILSKNLLSESYYNSAYWITEHTLGWITKDQQIVINHETEELYFKAVDSISEKSYKNEAMIYYKIISDYVLKKAKN